MFSFTRRPAGSKTLVEYLLFLEAGAGEKKPEPVKTDRLRNTDTESDTMMCLPVRESTPWCVCSVSDPDTGVFWIQILIQRLNQIILPALCPSLFM